MLKTRVIPCLLLKGEGLVKTVKFKNETYIGDPINAIKIFNDKEVDELVLLDILASREAKEPNFKYIESLAGECFMPLAYGGGVSKLEHIANLNSIGVEKVIINSAGINNPDFLRRAVDRFGSSSIVLSLDIKKNFMGKPYLYTHSGSKKVNLNILDFFDTINEINVGEIVINSIDHDGMMNGYNLELIKMISSRVTMPVVALGGAGKKSDFDDALKAGASAVAAGSMFVYYGPHKAVLINYTSH